jgi:hypothetical protein
MDMKKILQAIDGAASKPVEGVDSMSKFLQVVKEADLNQSTAPVAAAAEPMQSPEQIKYNQLRAQWDGYQAMTDSGPNTFVSKDPAHDAKLQTIPAELARMAAALKAKGIDAEADYAAISGPKSAPVDINQMYKDDEVAAVQPVPASESLNRFLSIVKQNNVSILNEGKGPLNRLSQAESIAVYHTDSVNTRATITSPVLNVAKDAKPSMVGKYFKQVEEEFAESKDRYKDRARQLAERVIERIVPGEEPAPGINRLTGKPNVPDAMMPEPAAPTAPVQPLSSRYDPRFKNGPEPYTIDIGGTVYKFAGRDKQGPGTGEVIKVPAAVIGIRGLGAVNVELGKDGLYYPAPKTESVSEAPIAMDPAEPNNPTIHGHEKANAMSLKGRIMSARAQLKELAELADSNELLVWEKITQLHKGGMFMGLAQNLEQIRHGIEELAAKRKKGGIQSRGIDNNIGEQGVEEAGDKLGEMMPWPEIVNKVSSAMKATGWKSKRMDDGAFMFSTKGQETDDQWYFVVIESEGDNFFSYALGTVEDGDPHIDDAYKGKLPNTAASVSELMNEIRDGYGLNETMAEACWKNYKQIGMKKKGGKTVPNCVPK